MSQLKSQGFKGIIFTYIGFAIGVINILVLSTLALTKNELGLVQTFVAVSTSLVALGNLGSLNLIYKFIPYYNRYLRKNENDLPFITVLLSMIGLIFVISLGYFNIEFINIKFGKSPLFIEYVYLLPIFVFFHGIYLTFSALLIQYFNGHIVTFINEIGFRAYNMVILIGLTLKFYDFNVYILLYSLIYLISCLTFIFIVIKKNVFKINFKISKLSKRFKLQFLKYGGFMWFANVCLTLAPLFDTIGLAGLKGGEDTAIYSVAFYISMLISIPQKSILPLTIPIISECWRTKNIKKLEQLYKDSSEILIILGGGFFMVIWLNLDLVYEFIPAGYEKGKYVVFWLCIAKLFDFATSLNGHILSFSTKYWHIDLLSLIGLIILLVPLNYFLIIKYGILGPAYANVISYFLFNLFRTFYLYKKTKIQPFRINLIFIISLLLFSIYLGQIITGSFNHYNIVYKIFINILITIILSVIIIFSIIRFKLSPEFNKSLDVVKTRFLLILNKNQNLRS